MRKQSVYVLSLLLALLIATGVTLHGETGGLDDPVYSSSGEVRFDGGAIVRAHAESQAEIVLPVEIYPNDGTSSETETITIDIADNSAVDSVGFRMHQPTWHHGGTDTNPENGFVTEGAVSIQINGGGYIDVTESNVDLAYPDRNHGGLDGFLPVVRFAVPASFSGGTQNGTNTIDIRWNGTKGIRSGTSLLGIAAIGSGVSIQDYGLWDDGGLLADGATTFSWDDPNTWSAPSGASVSAGETAWLARGTLTDHVNGSEQSINAACSDCHFKDGGDLQLLSYSNERIIARSRFHNLSQGTAEDIAAYIRSIEYTDSEGTTYDYIGRPWNPPFQPGPTYGLNNNVNAWDELTDDESYWWFAGAGIDYFLNTGFEEAYYMWAGNGDPANNVRPTLLNYFDDPSNPDGGGNPSKELGWRKWRAGDNYTTDHKKYPISLLFPDWNMWLPDVSPVGDFETSGSCDVRTWNSGEVWNKYEEFAGDGNSVSFAGSNSAGENRSSQRGRANIAKDFTDFNRAIDDFRDACNRKHASTQRNMLEDQGLQGWAMVKNLEGFQWFDFYDLGNETFEHYNQNESVSSDLQNFFLDISVFGSNRLYFNSGPHIMGNVIPDGSKPLIYHGGLGQLWGTHVWYQLQVTLDSGLLPNSGSGNPVDWQYQDAWMAGWGEGSGTNILFRQLKSQSLRWQEAWDLEIGVGIPPSQDGSQTEENLDPNPWGKRLYWVKQGQPMRIHGCAKLIGGGAFHKRWPKGMKSKSDAITEDACTAFARAWAHGFFAFPLSEYQSRQNGPPGGGYDNGRWLEEPSYVPDESNNLSTKNDIGTFYYKGVKAWSNAGMNATTIDSVSDRLRQIYPQANESNYASNSLSYSYESLAGMSTPPSGEYDDVQGTTGGDSGGGGGPGATEPPVSTVFAPKRTSDDTFITGGQELGSGVTVELICRATDDDGTGLTKCDFYNGDTLLGTDNTLNSNDEFTFTFSPADGSYDTYGEVFDNEGSTFTSTVSFTVGAVEPPEPSFRGVSITDMSNVTRFGSIDFNSFDAIGEGPGFSRSQDNGGRVSFPYTIDPDSTEIDSSVTMSIYGPGADTTVTPACTLSAFSSFSFDVVDATNVDAPVNLSVVPLKVSDDYETTRIRVERRLTQGGTREVVKYTCPSIDLYPSTVACDVKNPFQLRFLPGGGTEPASDPEFKISFEGQPEVTLYTDSDISLVDNGFITRRMNGVAFDGQSSCPALGALPDAERAFFAR